VAFFPNSVECTADLRKWGFKMYIFVITLHPLIYWSFKVVVNLNFFHHKEPHDISFAVSAGWWVSSL
jgi:hypothetical protein